MQLHHLAIVEQDFHIKSMHNLPTFSMKFTKHNANSAIFDNKGAITVSKKIGI